MADISRYLQDILDAVYGEEVRGSIHDAIEIINDVSEVVLTTGTAVDSPSSSSEGFFTGSLYLNTDTYELWKCVGVDTWQSLGILKGDKGDDGADGEDGNRWYRGTGISGKAQNPTVYSGSGVADANVNDFYLNPIEGAVYHCVTGGAPAVATWSYDFTMTGGGGGGTSDYNDLVNQPKINNHTLVGSMTSADLGLAGASDIPDALADLTGDVEFVGVLTEGQVLAVKSNGKWGNQPPPSSGNIAPTPSSSLDESDVVSAVNDALTIDGGENDEIPSLYGMGQWTNTDSIILMAEVDEGDDGLGTWEDNWESGSRSGWLWDESLYQILEDGNGNRRYDIHVEPIFDVGDSEAVSLYSWRIDDDYPQTIGGQTVNGGCVAFKFNGEIQSEHAYIGIEITRLRTKYKLVTPLT